MNKKKDTNRASNSSKKHGGWREGAGRKKSSTQTKIIRIDVRLLGIIEALKEKLKNGAMNDAELRTFEELATN